MSQLLHASERSDFFAGPSMASSHCTEATDYPSLPSRPWDQVSAQTSLPPPHFIENQRTALGVFAGLSTIYRDELDPNATPFAALHL